MVRGLVERAHLVLVWDPSEYSGLGCVFVCRRVWVGGIGGIGRDRACACAIGHAALSVHLIMVGHVNART